MPLRRRDKIALEKILSELDIGLSIMNGYSKEAFLANEVIKRAMAMTAINIGELVWNYESNILKFHRERLPGCAI